MIEIRSCHGFEEMQACVELQTQIWGYDQSDIMPRKAFVVAQAVGGQVLGAFENGTPEAPAPKLPESLVGFVFSLPGIKIVQGEPRPYLHSHMLAVREAYRNRGLGAQLKQEQRREALSRGIKHMEWTFDPLEIKNAFLNIHRLGAVVRTYRVNFYGVSSSRLQGGLPTDRLLAEWELDSPRVETVLNGNSASASKVIVERIVVPASIYEWKATEAGRERALAVQLQNRHKFQQAFAQGLAVIGFSLDADANGIFELGPLPRP